MERAGEVVEESGEGGGGGGKRWPPYSSHVNHYSLKIFFVLNLYVDSHTILNCRY